MIGPLAEESWIVIVAVLILGVSFISRKDLGAVTLIALARLLVAMLRIRFVDRRATQLRRRMST
jgi:hypothetical protein